MISAAVINLAAMPLSSQSTDEEVRAAYEDSADYDVTNDATKARTFIVACRILLGRISESVGRNGAQVALRTEKYERELEQAKRWLGRRTGRRSYRFADFGGYRE